MPSITLFLASLFLGTLLALSRAHWIFVWVGLELNLLSFIPLLTSSPLTPTTEAAITYFLAQALGSGLFLLGALTSLAPSQIFIPLISPTLFILLGLLTKLGFPPFHFWFPSVIALASWPLCLLLTTWQKLTPLFLLFYSLPPKETFPFILLISTGAVVGGVGGLTQTQLRPLLAYSSIGHTTWIITARISSFSISLIYLRIYIAISIPLFWTLSTTSSSSNISTLNLTFAPLILKINIFLLIISLGGLPPFLGFLPKLIVIESLRTSIPFILLILIIGSLLNLYYYLNLVFINILSSQKSPLIPQNLNSSPLLNLLLLILGALTLGLSNSLFLLTYALIIFY